MEITELVSYRETEYNDLAYLMQVLDPSIKFTKEALEGTISHPSSHLYVMRDEGKIIGCYTLGIFFSPTGRKASIEDVVIHPFYQGQHLGKEMMEDALTRLRELSPIHIQLTSRPHRISANRLYLSVGFKAKETNVYVMDIAQ